MINNVVKYLQMIYAAFFLCVIIYISHNGEWNKIRRQFPRGCQTALILYRKEILNERQNI